MKKKVIAYLHTHWDREWYREYEVFRIRLLRVFDNVLNLLETGKIPSFYFDGQVSALLDYLEIRPEKTDLVKRLCEEKKLFIGPFYCLIDEFLTSKPVFEKNLEIGIKIAKNFGCTDFIGYLADTFGHSKNVPPILNSFGINKAIVWRGCGDLPSEFKFNGINTVNLIRGYFMDIFSTPLTLEEKIDFLKSTLDKIAEKSSDTILLPIGADHLGIEENIQKQILLINQYLENYELKLGSPFDYFEKVKNNFNLEFNNELRDNSKTFILTGTYSSRLDLKRYNVECSYKLDLADKAQKHFKLNYANLIEYAYKLLLQNQAHDSICGCSTDDVHSENIIRYKKILQIADTIIDEVKFKLAGAFLINLSDKDFSGLIKFKSSEERDDLILLTTKKGFENDILSDTQKIPITEDYKNIYTCLANIENIKPLELSEFKPVKLPLPTIKLTFDDKINIEKDGNIYSLEFIDFKDTGDSYNFGADKNDTGTIGKIIHSTKVSQHCFVVDYKINENILLAVNIFVYKNTVNFKIKWENTLKNHLLQAKINFKNPIIQTYSEDMNELIKRNFDPNYDIRKNLPKEKGFESKTNTAPMQRFVWTQELGIVTKGLTEYEIHKNSLLITMLRATGLISNPENPTRTTPAGPPIPAPNLQMTGENTAEFILCLGDKSNYKQWINLVFPYVIF